LVWISSFAMIMRYHPTTQPRSMVRHPPTCTPRMFHSPYITNNNGKLFWTATFLISPCEDPRNPVEDRRVSPPIKSPGRRPYPFLSETPVSPPWVPARFTQHFNPGQQSFREPLFLSTYRLVRYVLPPPPSPHPDYPITSLEMTGSQCPWFCAVSYSLL